MDVFDLEADGLNPTKIHCISVMSGGKLKSTSNYANMRKFFSNAKVLIGHNITRFDIPVVEKLLGVEIKAKLIDTLALSWYLQPERVRHGLAWYGEDYGIPKPVVEDWHGLSPEEYIYRCEEDVKINTRLWEDQWKYLLRLYGSEEEAWRFLDYISFKMDCAREQERRRWKLDVSRAERVVQELAELKESKTEALAKVMPKVAVKVKKTRPKKPYKQDGSPSKVGSDWFNLLLENNLPNDFTGIVEKVNGYKEPNPGSMVQIKDWLYSLGWVPETFEFKRDKETGDTRKIPQVNLKFGGGVCSSVKRLFTKEPALEVLEGLSILTHRISILKGFLSAVDEDGYIQAQVQGLTNTLRFKHKVVVNLPGIDKPYGEDIRGCLICEDDEALIGSDVCSLEDVTKRSYMYDYDPEYVEDMRRDGFDPHTNLAVFAKAMTKAQEDAHKAGKEDHSAVRKTYKAANYACVYGAGGATVGRTAGISTAKGEKLVEDYWKLNWSVKAIAEDQVTKTCGGRKWLFNPVSKLWYSLRYVKDIFSTLNQGTGVFVFDTWVKHIRKVNLPIVMQYHDEVVCRVKKGNEERAMSALKKAMEEANNEIQLKEIVRCDTQVGGSYGDIH